MKYPVITPECFFITYSCLEYWSPTIANSPEPRADPLHEDHPCPTNSGDAQIHEQIG